MKIIKVQKDSQNEIINVMLDNQQVISTEEAIKLVSQKQIENITVGHSKLGQTYLRSYPNQTDDDNLDNLPTF